MSTITQYILLTPEELKADRMACINGALAMYIEATKEQPLAAKEILEKLGKKDIKVFYKLRREKGAKPVKRIGNVDFYLLSDFLK